MEVQFYKFKSAYDGFRVQTTEIEKTETMTKKQLMEIADLRHPVYSRKEFFDVISHDKDGKPLKQFEILSSMHLLRVTR